MIKLDLIHSFPIEEYLLTRLALSPDATEIAVGHKQFRTYDAETGVARAEFAFPEFLAQLRYSPDGRFIAAANVADNHPSTRGRLDLFDAPSGEMRFTASAQLPVETAAFDETGDYLFWNHAQTVSVDEQNTTVQGGIAGVNLTTLQPLDRVALPQLQIRNLAIVSDGFACFGRDAQGEAQTVEDANLIFRHFRLHTARRTGERVRDFDLGIGAGVSALSPDGRLLAVEMVDFRNNERHVSLIDVETGVEANLLPLEANTLPVLEFGLGSEYLLCMKEDAEANFNVLRIWRTEDLKLVGEAQIDLSYHSMTSCLAHSTVAFLGGGKLDLFALE